MLFWQVKILQFPEPEKIDKVEDNGNNDVQVEVLSNSIVSVVVRGMNRMIVTLEKATEKPLQKKI